MTDPVDEAREALDFAAANLDGTHPSRAVPSRAVVYRVRRDAFEQAVRADALRIPEDSEGDCVGCDYHDLHGFDRHALLARVRKLERLVEGRGNRMTEYEELLSKQHYRIEQQDRTITELQATLRAEREMWGAHSADAGEMRRELEAENRELREALAELRSVLQAL